MNEDSIGYCPTCGVVVSRYHADNPSTFHRTTEREAGMMMTLTDFLLARIAEDERLARDAASEGEPPRTGWQIWTNKVSTTPGGEKLGPRGTVEAHPSRVLAECEAKRRIVRLHDNRCQDCAAGRRCITHDVSAGQPSVRYRDPVDWLALTALALPYADHPDYREEWKP